MIGVFCCRLDWADRFISQNKKVFLWFCTLALYFWRKNRKTIVSYLCFTNALCSTLRHDWVIMYCGLSLFWWHKVINVKHDITNEHLTLSHWWNFKFLVPSGTVQNMIYCFCFHELSANGKGAEQIKIKGLQTKKPCVLLHLIKKKIYFGTLAWFRPPVLSV